MPMYTSEDSARWQANPPPACLRPREHDANDLAAVFDALFAVAENTRLVRGTSEPEYLPAGDEVPFHRVIYANGFFASALHEIAHWCVAGPARRALPDYGYWYAPDGRTPAQQAEFERVEVKPQALEWVLSACCGFRFHVSADNTNAGRVASRNFKRAIAAQARRYCREGLPGRAARLAEALQARYATVAPLAPENYRLELL